MVITAALLSGSVLIAVLTPALRNSKISLFLIIGILGAHFLLAAGFMLCFFHVPSSGNVAGGDSSNSEALLAAPGAVANAAKQIAAATVKAVVGNINETKV